MPEASVLEKNFKQLIKTGSLGHAYVLYGGSLVQELEFARSLAHFLETNEWEVGGRPLSDALVMDGTQANLGVDAARSFSDFLYRQPAVSGRRTLIVHAAGELTPQAQNAILKIAEEPPPHSLIILTVGDLNVLMPTLLSRFQKIAFSGGGSAGALSPAQEQARGLIEKFLMSTEKQKADIIKDLVAGDRDIEEKGDKVLDHFVSGLIEELAKKPESNWRALKQILHRYTLMSDYQTNKRLQLEAVLQFLK